MKRYLASKIEQYSWFKSLFDYYKALREAGTSVFFHSTEIGADGLRIPDPLLLVSTTGTDDIETYLESGRLAKASIIRALAAHGYDIATMDCILDFGCGCGRVLRHWRALANTKVYATDVDTRAVKWCRENLSFADITACHPEPPLSYDSEFFQLMYALSVLTHLSEPSQKAWLREWHRILRPGGILLFSLHGEYYRS
jgi:SAM-dependent methyltransferase